MPATKTDTDSLAQLRLTLRSFARKRDWEQFHTPKNLAMALSIEAAEIMEHFQWLTPRQCACLDKATRQALSHEIADVLIYLTRLADVLDIDPVRAARRKMRLNARRYPVALARGNATKHDVLARRSRPKRYAPGERARKSRTSKARA